MASATETECWRQSHKGYRATSNKIKAQCREEIPAAKVGKS
jgi:hypothetical protein